jgi:hypothetical protein
MGVIEVAAPEPTHAERVRSVLAAAGSIAVVANGTRDDLVGSGLIGFQRGVRLCPPSDSWLLREAECAPEDGVPVLLECTDVAPLAMRERVRARVCMVARLHRPQWSAGPEGRAVMQLDLRQVALDSAGFSTLVDPAELLTVEPDPVAGYEAALLMHLVEDHQGHVAGLARLLDARQLLGVTAVTPLALDRYGIVLRLDYYHRASRDVRLAFSETVADVEELGQRIHALIAHSPRPGRRSTTA